MMFSSKLVSETAPDYRGLMFFSWLYLRSDEHTSELQGGEGWEVQLEIKASLGSLNSTLGQHSYHFLLDEIIMLFIPSREIFCAFMIDFVIQRQHECTFATSESIPQRFAAKFIFIIVIY